MGKVEASEKLELGNMEEWEGAAQATRGKHDAQEMRSGRNGAQRLDGIPAVAKGIHRVEESHRTCPMALSL